MAKEIKATFFNSLEDQWRNYVIKTNAELEIDCYNRKNGIKTQVGTLKYVGYTKLREFFDGDQWEYIPEAGGHLRVYNYVATTVFNYTAFMTNEPVEFDVPPQEITDPIEIARAETKETILKVDQFFKTISSQVRKRFKNPKLVSTLEFPVLFLGAKPSNTPSFYNFMNFADFGLGTWHPKGGMYEIIKAMHNLALELGVQIQTASPIEKIIVENGRAIGVSSKGKIHKADVILSGADYHHSELLLDKGYRQYSENYWESRTFAPSSLLFYIGFNKKLKNVEHHNLFFDTDFELHAKEIYDEPKWPSNPLFYANFPSVTDSSVAPENCETGFFLVPIATDLEDTEELRATYFNMILDRFEAKTNQKIRNNIIFNESFCVKDFKDRYNSYKGNAYGMANTLTQTAFLRPNLRSKKVKGLYFTGQLTVPGPGVPPSLISGKLVSELIVKDN